MNFLKDTYETYGTDVSGRLNIIGFVLHDSGAYPTADEFNGFHLLIGTKLLDVTDGSIYYFDGVSTWNLKSNSLFDNVYTKQEMDAMLSAYETTADVNTKLSNYYTKAETDSLLNKMKNYILICNSSLNLISLHDGISTGHFCQDLAINLPAGDYIWKMQRDGNTQTSMRIKAADDTSLYNVTRGAGVNDITQNFTITGTGAKISIYTGSGISVWGCMIYKDT